MRRKRSPAGRYLRPALALLVAWGVARGARGQEPGPADRPSHATADRVLPPGLVSRAAWGAATAKPGMRPQTPRRLTVHHTATRSPETAPEVAKLLRGIQRYHQQDQKWHDIAYHYLVDRAGRVHEGRDHGFQGASGTVYDLSDRVLVCLVGDFTADLPPEAQWDATVVTLAWLCRRHGIDPGAITMHRDHAGTTCPGDAFAGLVADGTLVEAVRRVLGQGE